MARPSFGERVGRFVLEQERRLKLAYVAAALLLCGFIAAERSGLGLGDRMLRTRETRWVERLETGEALVAAGRYDEAVESLTALDTAFPARVVKHALGRERERLLVALGTALEKSGHPRRARETFQQLAAFDPRNYADHLQLAACLLRQGRYDEALEPWARALAIHPTYLPAVVQRIDASFDLYKFREIAGMYREYQEAYLVSDVEFEFDGTVVACPVSTDGRFHDVSVRAPAGPAKSVRMRCAEYALELGQGRARHPLVAGTAGGETPRELAPDAWKPNGIANVRPSVHAPAGVDGWLDLDTAADASGVSRIDLRLRLLRPVYKKTLDRVAQSLRNLPDATAFGIDPDRVYVAEPPK